MKYLLLIITAVTLSACYGTTIPISTPAGTGIVTIDRNGQPNLSHLSVRVR